MSSIFVLPQTRSVHMMTDGLVYDRDGIVQATNLAKAHSLPTLPMVMSCTGPAFMSPLIAEKIAMEFSSFDEYIDRADEWLPAVFDAMAEKHRDGDAASSFYVIGWHERENRPAAYCADLWTDKSSRIERILANGGDRDVPRAKLIEQTTIAGTPLKPDLVEQCGFRIRRADDYDPELDLMHVTEVARQERLEGAHWVGGKILLTSIDAKGITQRVVHHYAQDRVGEAVVPESIDWQAWRAAREKPAGSWLKRQMAERKMRKRVAA